MAFQQLGCPHCGKAVQVDEQHAGETLSCPLCGGQFMVPASDAAPGKEVPLPPPADYRFPPPETVLTPSPASAQRPASPLVDDGLLPPTVPEPLRIMGGSTLPGEASPSSVKNQVVARRRLAPEAVARRRFWRSILMAIGCFAILLATVLWIISERRDEDETPTRAPGGAASEAPAP